MKTKIQIRIYTPRVTGENKKEEELIFKNEIAVNLNEEISNSQQSKAIEKIAEQLFVLEGIEFKEEFVVEWTELY